MAFQTKGFRARRKSERVGVSGEHGAEKDSVATESPSRMHQWVAWITDNPKIIRNTIFGIAGAVVLAVLLLVLRAAAKDEHSRKLHAALEKYEQIKLLPRGETRSAQMKEFGMSLQSTCEQVFSTLESAAACLTAGNALLEAREFTLAANFFGRAASAYNTDAMSSIARFMQAQAFEGNREFDKALAAYKSLEKEYTLAKKIEISNFHQARMLYYLGRFDEAEEKFTKLIKDSDGKEYSAPSRNYLSMLNAERAAKGASNDAPTNKK